MAIAFCPDCDGSVSVGPKPMLGQHVNCPLCDAELEVIEVSPLELDWAYDEPNVDWDQDDEWDDDEEWDEDDEEWDEDDEEWDEDDDA